MTVAERAQYADSLLSLQKEVLSLLFQGMGAIDIGVSRHGARGAYYQPVSGYLTQALEVIDVALNLDCSHLLVRDIHDPEKLLVSTSSAKSTFFCRERFSTVSPFLTDLAGELEGHELSLRRRDYPDDRLWELLRETMTTGPYARPWSLVGFPLRPASADGPNRRDEPIGFLIFVGPRGWFSAHADESSAFFDDVVSQFAITAQIMRNVSRLATLSDWASPALTEEMATVGKLHGVLAPLQRLELKLGIAEQLLERSRPHREITSGFEVMRTEIFDAQRCVRDFLDTRILARPAQAKLAISPTQYIRPQQIIDTAIGDLQELAERRKKTFVVRSANLPPLAISATDFELVVANLLHNAVKYGDPNSKIKVESELRGHRAVLDVTSYGIDIGPTERERVFEPGYRTTDASKIEYTAAGLGLFAARRAAERWGGHLFLRSRERLGSVSGHESYRITFRLELPC